MATITKYNAFLKNQFNGTSVIDFDTDTLKVALVTNTYVPNAATHVFFSDITNQVTGTNYTAGGTAVAGKTLVEAAGVVTFDGNDVTWLQSATGFSTARYAILYKDTGTAATSPLIGYIDFTADKGNVTGDLTVQWGAGGVFTVA